MVKAVLNRALRRNLANGLVALACRHDGAEHVELALALPAAGSAGETAEQCGLAGFAARATLLGTAELDFGGFHRELDSFGASLAARPGADHSEWRGSCLTGDLPRLLGLLRAALESPRLDPADVERLRSELLVGIRERDQDTMRVARMAALEMAYGRDHPYGRPPGGYLDTVGRISLAGLRRFAQERLGPEGGAVVAVGPRPAQDLIEVIDGCLGDWRRQEDGADRRDHARGAGSGAGAGGRRRDLALPGKTQTDIAMAVPAVPRRHPDFEALGLANLILGRFGLGGRLGRRVRDDLGLAYYCYSALVGARGAGPWLLAAGVNPVHVDRALATVREELDRLRSEPVTEAELQESVGWARGSLVVELEDPAGMAGAILNLEVQGLGLGYVRDYLDWLDRVEPGALLAAAQRYLDPAEISVVTAGPEGEPG